MSTTPKSWTVTTDSDGGHHTKCPKCEAQDTIAERDVAVRWNALRLASTNSASASTGPANFEGEGWICTECLTTDLVAPEGFEITDWF